MLHRMITAAWGVAYVGEFIIRVVMVFTLPAAVVLIVSPIILTIATVGAIAATFAYVRHAYRRAAEMRRQLELAAAEQA
jgi:hypothetical protein